MLWLTNRPSWAGCRNRTCVLYSHWLQLLQGQGEAADMPSTIEWTDETWNPVTGCSRVSPGCDNCYMFALYPRLRAMDVPGYETAPDSVQMLPERLRAPLSWRRPRRVFVNSMSDLFHPHVEYGFISDIFAVMLEANQHVFQVLTKRPGRAAGWWKFHGQSRLWRVAGERLDGHLRRESEVCASADRAAADPGACALRVRGAPAGED